MPICAQVPAGAAAEPEDDESPDEDDEEQEEQEDNEEEEEGDEDDNAEDADGAAAAPIEELEAEEISSMESAVRRFTAYLEEGSTPEEQVAFVRNIQTTTHMPLSHCAYVMVRVFFDENIVKGYSPSRPGLAPRRDDGLTLCSWPHSISQPARCNSTARH